MLKRILDSYRKEKEDCGKHKKYKISGIWCRRDEVALNKGELVNFGASHTTGGLSLIRTIPTNKTEEFNLIKQTEKHLKIWSEITKLPIEVLQYPRKFSLSGITIQGVFTIQPSFRFSYYAKIITDLIKGDVVEIGGGFGGVPYHLFKDFDFKGTYLNFDLPDVNVIEKYFLMSVFPKKRFLLYGEDNIKNFKNYDVVLMPHYAIKDMPECEMVFNAHSLMEMGNTQIQEYLKQIDRIAVKFLHFNHESQSYLVGRKVLDVNEKNLMNLEELELPNWRRIYKTPELLSGDDTLNYHEYYYEKI